MRTFLLSILLGVIFLPISAQITIKMQKDGGVYKIPCKVNGLRMKFVFDTGASSVSLSLTEAKFMLENDYIATEDIIGSGKTQIADGSIVENTKIILREINIGGIILKNIEASVIHDFGAPLLLGQTAIERLGLIQMKGDELTILEHAKQQSSEDTRSSMSKEEQHIKMLETLKEARDQMENKLYNLSLRCYAKIEDTEYEYLLDSHDYYCIGISLHNTHLYEPAIEYFFKSLKKESDTSLLSEVHFCIGKCYYIIDNYKLAEKHLLLSKEKDDSNENNYRVWECLGRIHVAKNDKDMASKMFGQAADYYGKVIGVTQKDIMKGKVHNTILGDLLFSVILYMQNVSPSNKYEMLKIAAKTGSKDAKELIEEARNRGAY